MFQIKRAMSNARSISDEDIIIENACEILLYGWQVRPLVINLVRDPDKDIWRLFVTPQIMTKEEKPFVDIINTWRKKISSDFLNGYKIGITIKNLIAVKVAKIKCVLVHRQ
ncbi:hypothetical protein Bhyg_03684 [Pseudolycoriella hygida]|uniref:Uncharacterized protein n=1 Tax=Pseudolycoriella hygida TaxID=35572 RepID=A0A9Q0S9J6_9DIPT|nr:hypothetical protein Bhyg_03684 [Pseudolycoriella hygida]